MEFFNMSIELLEKSVMKYVRTKIIYIRNVIQAQKCAENSISNALRIIDDIMDNKGKSNELLRKFIKKKE